MHRVIEQLRALKRETHALALAMKHPRTPWVARVMAAAIVAYAVSPIDLIPDFIPLLGALDDLLILPIAIFFTVRLIPEDVLEECRTQAKEARLQKNWAGAALVVVVWGAALAFILAAVI